LVYRSIDALAVLLIPGVALPRVLVRMPEDGAGFLDVDQGTKNRGKAPGIPCIIEGKRPGGGRMRKLIAGIHRFQKRDWSANKELYRRLAEHGQFPDALFITCCDSRVDPLRITHGQPGDLFILRNIGNFVPPYVENPQDGCGIGAAVEYGVKHLDVRDIIVCGHSDCGALKALYKDRAKFSDTPHTAQWLRYGDRTMAVVAANYPELSREERYEVTAEENVLLQIENLRGYPIVQNAVREGHLHLHAWYFEIGTGMVFRYSPEREQFEPIREEEE
jgi:carbonic anhydrase